MRYIIVKIEEPARRRSLNCRKAETRIQSVDDVVLGSGNVIRNKRLGATLTCRLNCDVHCFKLKLSTEYATAHYPIFDLKYVVIVGCGAKDNRANETVVANS